MRGVLHRLACYSCAGLLLSVPEFADAQERSSEYGLAQANQVPEPEPDPGGFDIQHPEARFFGMVATGAGNEYRDRLVSKRHTGSVAAGLAFWGISVSGWRSWELSTGKDAHELLVGYSYKLPFVDIHAGFVACGNERMYLGCPDGIRTTLTSSSIARTTLEGSIDLAASSRRRSISASVTRDIWADSQSSGAVRVSWTRTRYGNAAYLDGASIRMIASERLTDRLTFDIALGSAWTSGRAKLPSAGDGLIATAGLVWRR